MGKSKEIKFYIPRPGINIMRFIPDSPEGFTSFYSQPWVLKMTEKEVICRLHQNLNFGLYIPDICPICDIFYMDLYIKEYEEAFLAV